MKNTQISNVQNIEEIAHCNFFTERKNGPSYRARGYKVDARAREALAGKSSFFWMCEM